MSGRALLASIFVAGLAAPWAAPAAAADLPGPRVPGVLRVLVSSDEMPEVFSFKSDGLPGFERELVEGFTRTRKLELQIISVRNWDQIIPMLVKGQGDLIVGIVDTEARRKRISFTSEIYPVRHLVVTREPRPAVPSGAELRKLTVAVIPGTTWADAATEAGVPAASQLPCADLHEALEAVRKEDATLLAALDEYLGALRQSPVRSALAVKYFTEDALGLLRRARKEE